MGWWKIARTYWPPPQREFVEETGYELADQTEFFVLGSVTMKGGKQVHAWAFEGAWEAGRIPASNTFSIEWPPRSGRSQSFAEIDRAEMFEMQQAQEKINPAQRPFLDRLSEALRG